MSLSEKRANEGKSLATAIIARTSEHVRRLALIRAVSRNPKEPVVDGEEMLWAEKVVQLSQDLMIPAVEEHVADTLWEANLKKLHRIIRAHGGWMDGTTLNNRCKFLNSRDRDMALRQLENLDRSKLNRADGNQAPPLLSIHTETNPIASRVRDGSLS